MKQTCPRHPSLVARYKKLKQELFHIKLLLVFVILECLPVLVDKAPKLFSLLKVAFTQPKAFPL